jgi:hypothetical protein
MVQTHHHELWGDLPILGTLRECAHTDFGWRAVDVDGVVLEVRSWEQARGRTTEPARIPDNDCLLTVANGRVVGVVMLERKWRRRRGKPLPRE